MPLQDLAQLQTLVVVPLDGRLPPADPNIQAAEPRDSMSCPRPTHPTTMLLGTSPRCAWHPDASVRPRKEDIKCIPSTIYTLTGAIPSVIKVSTCPQCPPRSHRCCSPDLGSLGLFNYNNHTVLMHELLDEYTSAYTLAETPFGGWTVGIWQ
ncbi:hypothetical protein JB92DRAFT_1373802 [Gautieria morchelliformis]|nr:hypothetical protein JB92DRAFT_1373802 [Gautieria morchelliformis]